MATPGWKKTRQFCHFNLLKPYYTRVADTDGGLDVSDCVHRAPAVTMEGLTQEGDGVPDESLLSGRLKNSESLCNLDTLLAHLQTELSELIHKFPFLFGALLLFLFLF